MNTWFKRIALAFCGLLATVAFAQEESSEPVSATMTRVVQAGHYDLWVRDFSAFAEEAIHHALTRGYYLPVGQRQDLLRDIRAQLAPEVLSQRLVVQMQEYANLANIQVVLSWYGSDVGRLVLRDIQHAYESGAELRQEKISASLVADEDRLEWWRTLSNQYPYTEHWLDIRDRVLFDGVSHLAQAMKPYAPFDAEQFKSRLSEETFELRPKVEERWMWRFMDSVRNLEVTELVRFRQFTSSPEHTAFVKIIGRETDKIIAEAIADMNAMVSAVVVAEIPTEEEPVETKPASMGNP